MTHVSYHNSTPIRGTALLDAVRAAEKQDAAVLALFASGGTWSPSQAHSYFAHAGKQWPITSIRRAMSNLTKAGALKVTGLTITGPHGHRENVWSRA